MNKKVRTFVGDAEANSLTPDRFWCVVFKEYLGPLCVTFVNDVYVDQIPDARKLSEMASWIDETCASCDEVRLVFHNGIDFDFHWFNQVLGIDLLNNPKVVPRDTYVLSRLAFPMRPGGHSVEAWGAKFGIMKTEIDDNQWAEFSPIMVERCRNDVLIQEKIYKELREKELRGFSVESVDLEHRAQIHISQQRRDGVYINPQKLHEMFVETQRYYQHLEHEITKRFVPKPRFLREYTPRRTKDGQWALRSFGQELDSSVVGGDFSSIYFEPFNLNSAPQRVERLLDLGWTPTEFTPKGAPKITEDSFKNLPDAAPQEVRMLGDYLMAYSRNGLCKQLLELVDGKNYLHGYVNTIGAATHRMSSNSPNLQNIPRATKDRGLKGMWGYEARELFSVEFPRDFCFIDCDASGIQLRGLAHYGNDPEYVSIVSDPSADIHDVHAGVLNCSRSVAKTFIYAFLMGGGAKKLVWVLGGDDVAKGRELLERFYVRFPFLKAFKQRLDKEVERGYHIALDGRLIRLDKEKPHKSMAVALQSYEAIVMKKSMDLYQTKLKKDGIWFMQRLMVHDEFLVESRHSDAQTVGNTIATSIADAGVQLGSKCPLAGAFKVGLNWAEVH